MILVTGATGNVGSRVLSRLAEKGQKVSALVRNKQAKGIHPKADVRVGNYEELKSLEAAMQGVTKVYLLASGSKLTQHEFNVIAAAQRAGVKHIVKHSGLGANYGAIELSRWHLEAEKKLKQSGIAWTILRPSGYASNALMWSGSLASQGVVYGSTGDGKLGIIDPDDIADCGVICLTKSGHEGKEYDLTGPAALSVTDQLAIINKVVGKQYRYQEVPDQAVHQAMTQMGLDKAFVDAMVEFYGMVRAGHAAVTTPTVKQLLGREPASFETWVKNNRNAFTNAKASNQ
jgi:uncharacterized protein YbjT (DUF2867 family)